MVTDEAIQNALANVYSAATMAHRLRALERQVLELLGDAVVIASSTGASHATIAGVAGVTKGRAGQLARRPVIRTSAQVNELINTILEFPADALHAHASGFKGRMKYPPYERAVDRWIPTVSRRDREHDENGRHYGETVDPAEQLQADLGWWALGHRVRYQKLPLVVAVDEKIVRIREVEGWVQDPGTRKWRAEGGRLLTDDELPEWWPEELRLGATLPIPAKMGAYTPARVLADGTFVRAVREDGEA